MTLSLSQKEEWPIAWFITLFLLSLSIMGRSQGILIESGAHLVTNGSAYLVVHDSKFTNSGNFDSGTGTVMITGTVADVGSEIGGSTTTNFYNLTLNKTMNHVQLGSTIQIANDLTFTQGCLNLAGHDLHLDGTNGSVVRENETNLIWGASGEIIITQDLNAPSAVNPGNLGVQISSAQNLGSTVVKRGHQQIVDGPGFSINRYFDISPANNTALDATLVFHYLESELAGIAEADLDIWRNDGSGWELQSGTLDMGANTVTKSGIPSFSTWTLAGGGDPLPIELLSFTGRFLNNSVELRWSTASELNNDFFTIERAGKDLEWKEIIKVDGAGQSNEVLDYKTEDANFPPGRLYYRLKQTDYDGSFEYSEVITLFDENLNGPSFTIYPNPASEMLTLQFSDNEDVTIDLFNTKGQLVASKKLMGGEVHKMDVSQLPEGIYFIKSYQALKVSTRALIIKRQL